MRAPTTSFLLSHEAEGRNQLRPKNVPRSRDVFPLPVLQEPWVAATGAARGRARGRRDRYAARLANRARSACHTLYRLHGHHRATCRPTPASLAVSQSIYMRCYKFSNSVPTKDDVPPTSADAKGNGPREGSYLDNREIAVGIKAGMVSLPASARAFEVFDFDACAWDHGGVLVACDGSQHG